MPDVGDHAPDFELQSTAGPLRLSELRARGKVVLSFYAEDRTPTCSTQIAALKNEHETLSGLGAVVVGISSDDLESHRSFEQKLGGLPFALAADPDLAVARAYDVADEESRRCQRAVFVIDEDGTILLRQAPYHPADTEQFFSIFQALGLEAV